MTASHQCTNKKEIPQNKNSKAILTKKSRRNKEKISLDYIAKELA
jgi:hypothetical protein